MCGQKIGLEKYKLIPKVWNILQTTLLRGQGCFDTFVDAFVTLNCKDVCHKLDEALQEVLHEAVCPNLIKLVVNMAAFPDGHYRF